MNGRCVFLSLKTSRVKFPRLSNVDKIVSGLSEVDEASCFVNLRFLVFGSS